MSTRPQVIEAEPQGTGHAPTTPTSVVILPEQPRDVTPLTLLDRAVAQGASIETLERLMGLHERYEKNNARRAFEEAFAVAKAEIEIVVKGRIGHNNKRYADFAAYARVVDPVLSKHGITYRFRTRQDDKTIHVTCIVSKGIHSEENTLAGPADQTGNKNAIQAIGSTLTYLQRYSLVQALGLAASEDDDGMAAGGAGTITEEQVAEIQRKIVRTGSDLKKFLGRFVVERIDELSPAQAQRANVLLDAKLAAEAKETSDAAA